MAQSLAAELERLRRAIETPARVPLPVPEGRVNLTLEARGTRRVAGQNQRPRTGMSPPPARPRRPRLGCQQEVEWDRFCASVVPHSHPNGPRGKDDVTFALVPTLESFPVLAKEPLAEYLHLTTLISPSTKSEEL